MSGNGPSRRALLGAAVGIPLLEVAGAEVAPPPPFGRSPSPSELGEEWERALDAFRAVEAEVRGMERATAGCSAEEEEVWLPAYEARLDSLGEVLRGVLLAQAPDFATFACKLELFFEHELEPGSVDEAVLGAIRRDARRLASFDFAQDRFRQAQDEREK